MSLYDKVMSQTREEQDVLKETCAQILVWPDDSYGVPEDESIDLILMGKSDDYAIGYITDEIANEYL